MPKSKRPQYEYKQLEVVDEYDMSVLVNKINAETTGGWRLSQIIPIRPTYFILFFERED